MTEENKQETAPVEETVKVSQEEVKELNDKIETVEQSKIDEAKKEVLEPVNNSLAELKKELADIKAQNDAIEAQRKAEEEEAKLKAEIEKQRQYQNQINKKHVVAPSENPVAPAQVAPEEPKLSTQEEWRLFEKHAGGNSASIDDLDRV